MANDEPDVGTGRLRLKRAACRFSQWPGAVARLCGEVALLLRRWWRSGRIRISPREGELLRLQPGDLVLYEPLRLQVLRRTTRFPPADSAESEAVDPQDRYEDRPAGEQPLPVVVLDCADDRRQDWRLTIRIPREASAGLCGTQTSPVIELTDSAGTRQHLQPGDVTVYARQSVHQADRAIAEGPAAGSS